ncbi:MAG TPA: hypothetical protein VJ548_13560 [Azospira sp.]|nr:hypothetical protein [Azospira sp.]
MTEGVASLELGLASSGMVAQPLQLVVKVNEGIRKVVGISRQVNLVALNAMLAAKQSGIDACGFGVVSGELRQFSTQLDLQMKELNQTIHTLVHSEGESARLRHHRAHFDAVQTDPEARPHVAAASRRLNTRQREMDEHSSDRWYGLQDRLDRALRLCGTGIALSRAAKIEAVHGNSRSRGLSQVAEEIETAILSIFGTLKQLRREVTQ